MKLKRCPFCGGGPIWIYDPAGERDGSEDRWNLSCDTCGITFEEGFRNRKDAIEAWNQRSGDASVCDSEGLLGGIRDAIREIEAVPSTELELKKGKWIDEKPNMYTRKVYCSECGCMALSKVKSEGDVYNPRYNIEFAKSNFCPNCGADMRGTL